MKRRSGAGGRAVRFAAGLAALLGGIGLLAGAALVAQSGRRLPSFEAVRARSAPSEARLLDRSGRWLHERRVRRTERRLEWTPLGDVSPALVAAIVGVEDRRFFAHRGVDARALAGAFRARLRGERRGASTLTMQLVAKLDSSLEPGAAPGPRRGRSLPQKLRQMTGALALEWRWSKREILEAYLNHVSFRGELVGVAAASRGLFDKAPHALDEIEAQILAALLAAPGASVGGVAARSCRLATLHRRWQAVEGVQAAAGREGVDLRGEDASACDRLTARTREALERPPRIGAPVELAPHLAARLLRRPGSLTTTLDLALQQRAIAALDEQLERLAGRGVRDGAVLAVENATGDVLVWVGSSGRRSASPQVDFVRARRQAGSTLKPLLYGLAFEERLLTPGTLLDDSPLDVPTGVGSYRPENYDGRFQGPVEARLALGSSLNIPAVRVLERVGVDRAVVAMRALGIAGLRPADYYGPSLALGAADVTLYELVSAYRALAPGGAIGALRVEREGERRSTPAPPAHAPAAASPLGAGARFLVADLLAERANRSLSFGLESALSTRGWSAVKTGTSKDMRDNWCLGFSDRYTVGVWVGNGSGEPMQGVSGVEGAAPVWSALMTALHADDPSRAPAPPPEIVATERGFRLRGTEAELRLFSQVDDEEAIREGAAVEGGVRSAAVLTRIVAPARDLVIAWDPDVPPARQRLLVEASPGHASLSLAVDGERLGRADAAHLWPIARGRHVLVLSNAAGETVDRVDFVVR